MRGHVRRSRRVLKMLGAGVGVAAAFFVLLALVPGSTSPVDVRLHPAGVASLEQVSVNGTRQWVLIRSEDVANPVILYLHGGPGTAQMTLSRRDTADLERYYTVVNWDQRGAGKSFAASSSGSRLEVAQFVDDVVDLSTQLARRFEKQKILLVGHSWGSLIGMLAVTRRPDLFSAYVGVGQMSRPSESERLSWEWTLDQARRVSANDDVAALSAAPPPYDGEGWRARYLGERRLVAKYGGEYHGSTSGALGVILKALLLSREYTLADRFNFFRGIFRSVDGLMPEVFGMDLFSQAPEVKVPVFFCLGRHDREVPSDLSARYLEALRAPEKRLVWFERSAHMPMTEERDAFNRFLVETVRPTVLQAESAPASTVERRSRS